MEQLFVRTEERRRMLETVRRFVEDEVAPRAAELDARRDPAESFSWEIVEKAHDVGIRTMTLGREYGGLGADSLGTALVIEELGRGDLGVYQACWLADHQEHGWDRTLGALPKVMASQAAWKIATWCLEIHGGHGYMKETGVEKLVRDAAGFLHSDGANRTLFLKAANFMFSE